MGGGGGESHQKSYGESYGSQDSQSTNQSQNMARGVAYSTGTPEGIVDAIMKVYGGSQGLGSSYGNMLESAMKGQGSAGNIPIIQQAVERSKQAASQTLAGTSDDLARSGLAGTPFGQAIMAQTRQQGAQAAAQTGPNILAQLISQVPQFLAQNAQLISSLAGVQGPSGSQTESMGSSHGQSTSTGRTAAYNMGQGNSKNLSTGMLTS